MTQLTWLYEDRSWWPRLKALAKSPSNTAAGAWSEALALARLRMDFVATNALDKVVQSIFSKSPPSEAGFSLCRLAILSTCTMTHLHSAIRVAGLRRGIWIEVYENAYGQYWQELLDTGSALHSFKPTLVMYAQDSHHVTGALEAGAIQSDADSEVQKCVEHWQECWRCAREAFNCSLMHQTFLAVHPTLLGLNEHRMSGSRARMVAQLNNQLRTTADRNAVDLLTLDARATLDGIDAWHNVDLWHRAKEEISQTAAPMYGDLVARLIAAKQGRSFKCLVLDLDNTLWGGVIGEDGLGGIVIGQGSALGEAYLDFQRYVQNLGRRGVILAVCSKNDEANALEVFERHTEMVLRRSDFGAFIANWLDKAANIRTVAAQLNIGLDSIVFVDDNPVERALIRQELPMVAVPEVSDEPITFISALAGAGYFEGVSLTPEDWSRSSQYQSNSARASLKAASTDITSYLRDLEMQLHWCAFNLPSLKRIVQLIGKTNQFNLTTKRYTEREVFDIANAEGMLRLQFRLVDRFGDNGIVAVCIGKMANNEELVIDTWLMSCRVLGRQVERATLNVICSQAAALGAKRIVGEYVPTAKNSLVKDHYATLGFAVTETNERGGSRAFLNLATFVPFPLLMSVHKDIDND